MSSGYTDKIKNGITFEEFTMTCARAFGVLIEMRDSSFNAKIPEKFEASNYHKNRIKEIKIEITALSKMSMDDFSKKAIQEYEKNKKYLESVLQKKIDLRAKYISMLGEAYFWSFPTSDHEELKNFMLEQIKSSIKFDCDIKYTIKELEDLVCLTGKQWFNRRKKELKSDLKYHIGNYAEEVKRAEFNTKWIQDLRASL